MPIEFIPIKPTATRVAQFIILCSALHLAVA
jgi:hypothetical protein